jgi:hypothetical protein
MSYKIQITVDKKLNAMIKTMAKSTGLSISSYARFALMSFLLQKKNKLLNQSLKDIESNDVEAMDLAEFNHQLDDLIHASDRANEDL